MAKITVPKLIKRPSLTQLQPHLIRVALLFAFSAAASGCTKGAKSVDTFFGSQAGDVVDQPTYALKFDPTSFDFGEVLITDTSPKNKTINVSNTSGVTLYVASAVGASADAVWAITNETCSLLQEGLVNNGTCQFTLNFKPQISGRLNYNVNFKFGLIKGDQTKNSLFTAFGRGMTPANIKIASGAAFDFGAVVRTAVSGRQITVTNAGDWPATTVSGYGPTSPFGIIGGAFPGIGGTCLAVLPGNSSCTVGVNFTPPSTSVFSSELDLAYFDGNMNQVSQQILQGTGALPAFLTISDGPDYDFGTKPVGAIAEKLLTISNSGGVTATSVNGSGLGVPFLFKGGSYPGTGGTCSNSIAAGTSCQIEVAFSPTAAGLVAASADIGYFDGLNSQVVSRAVHGTGVTPASLALSGAPTLDFGTAIVGSINQLTLTLTNSGGFSATTITPNSLTPPFAFRGGVFPGTAGTCTNVLSSGSSCTIVISYDPTLAGVSNRALQLTYSDGVRSQTTFRAIQGSAVTAATLLISNSPSYDFGSKPAGSSTDKSFSVTNTGGTTATGVIGTGLTSPFSFKGGSFPGTGGTCASSLNAAGSCTIVVTFAPSTTGAQAEDIQLAYFDGLANQSSNRTMTAVGVTPASLQLSDGPSYDFGSLPVGSITTKTLTLTNSGGFAASSLTGSGLSTPFAFKGGSFPGTNGTCTGTLAASAVCTLVVNYSPTSSSLSSRTLAIGYSDGTSTQIATLILNGTGVTPASLSISDGPIYDFGSIATGGFLDKSFTISNTGQYTAGMVSGASFTGAFNFKGGLFPGTGGTCGASLAPGVTCIVVVRFAPTALVSYNETFQLNYANGVTNVAATRAVQGVGTQPAILTVSDGPSYNFGVLPVGGALTKQLTISNSGGVAAQAVVGASLTGPFVYVGGSFPGTGGSCGSALAAASSCTLTILFSPTASGLVNETLNINYSDSVSNRIATRDLAGTGVAPAQLTISPSPSATFSTTAVGGSSELTLTVSNSGQYGSSLMSGSALPAPFAYKGGSYPGTGGTCSSNLAASASCSLILVYSPTIAGSQNSSYSITYFDGVLNQSFSRAIVGTGASPASLSIAGGATFDFGTLASGASGDHTFTLTNGGGFNASGIFGNGLALPFKFKGGAYPGSGGTCTGSLAAGVSCTFVASFAPTTTGAFTGTINIGYNDGASLQSTTASIVGTAVAPAFLTFSNSPLYDFGVVAVGASGDRQLTISNTGAVNATLLSGVALSGDFSFKGGTFPGTGGTCGSIVVPAGSCTVSVTYAPTAIGAASQTVNVSYNDGVNVQTAGRLLQGAGAAPGSLLISDGPSFSFGSLPSGGSNEKTFTVTNQGGVTTSSIVGASLNAPFTFKGGSYPGLGGTCATSLNATATCSIVLLFIPSSTGSFSGTLSLSYNNGLSTQTSARSVIGTAVAPALLVVSDGPTYDFGTVPTGGITQKSFTVSNNGGVAASTIANVAIGAPFAYKGGSFPGTGGTCVATLAAGSTCTLYVTYSPTATGSQSDSFTLSYFDGVVAQTASRGLAGIGATPAFLTLSDSPSFQFPTLAVGASSEKSFTLTNGGGVTASGISGLGLPAPFSFKGGTFPGTGGTCLASLAAASSCSVVVAFSPTSVTTATANLSIGYNDGVNVQSSVRALSGISVADALLITSDTPDYNFGTVAVGAVKEKTVTISNTGGYTATGLSASGLTGVFSFKGGSYPGTGGTCGSSLIASGNCSVVVNYAPTVSGASTTNFNLAYSDGANARTTTLGLQGLGAAPALITFSDGPAYNFGTRATGSATDKTFLLNNSGGVSATALGLSGLSVPFAYKGGAFPGTGGTCTTSLSAASVCTIAVTFAPTSTGSQYLTLTASYQNGVTSTTATRDVQGVGASPATLAISSGPSYDFGTIAIGALGEKSFTITNSGGVDAASVNATNLSAPYSFKGGSYPGVAGTCAGLLPAGSSCTVIVDYTPITTGSSSSLLSLNYQDGVSLQTASRILTGNALAPALLSISDGSTYDFGAIAATGSVDKIFTVTNSGALAASSMNGAALAPPFAFKGGAFPGTGGNCSSSLAASGTCNVVVTFHPTTIASFTAVAQLDYNDGAQAQSAVRALQGVGAAPASILISDGATYNFGNIPLSADGDKLLTLTNGGGITAAAISGLPLSPPYSFKGGSFPGTGGTCSSTLNATASCSVVVSFSPTTLGTQSSSLSIGFSDGLVAQTSFRGLTGTGVAPANLTLSDGPNYDFGTLATGSTLSKTFTVTNSGNFTATSMSATALAAPFSFKGGTYPGTGGNCSTILNIGATCSIVVNDSPTTTGSQSSQISISFFDGANSQASARGIQGTGASPAIISISDGATFDFGALPTGATLDKLFTLTNSGGVSATALAGGGLSTGFSFKGGAFPGTGGTCGAALAASSTCTVAVTFAPSSSGTFSSSFAIGYTDGVTTQSSSRAVVGTAVAPATLALSDGPTFDFGTVATGAVVEKSLTLTNSGGFQATSLAGSGLTSPFAFKGGTYPGSGGSCSGSLAASGTCTIVLVFTPAAVGLQNAIASINYYSGSASPSATRALQGTGATPASLAFSESPLYDFGIQATGSTRDHSFTITNSGGVTAWSLTGSALTLGYTYKGGTFPGKGGTCGATLGSASACLIVVAYTPIATGTQINVLTLTYQNGVSSTTATENLTGVGAAPALIGISDGPNFDFGSIASGGALDKTFTISNSGGVSATVLSASGLGAPFTFKGGAYPGTQGNCAALLSASATCTIVVTFAPAIVGAFSGSINLAYNDGGGSQSTSRTVQGAGVLPAQLSISDATAYDFGAVVVTGSAEKIFTVTNNGNLTATGLTPQAVSNPFSFKGGSFPGTGGTCGTTLNAGSTCNISVVFAPTSLGAASDGVTISYFNGAATQSVARPIQGTGTTAANLLISDGATFDFGTIANGASVEKTFTISNSGGVSAVSISPTALAAPFSFKGGTYPGTGGTCAAGLAPSATCTAVVNYSPSTSGVQTSTFALTYQNGLVSQTATRPLAGTAVVPATLGISDGPNYEFGTRATGSTIDKSLTITNSGAYTASAVTGLGLSGPFTFKGGTFPGIGGNCSTTLTPSGSCVIVVTYAPTATGAQLVTLQINYNNGANSQATSRSLQGTGAAPAILSTSDGPVFDFGTVAYGSSADKAVTITNSGGISASAVSGSGLTAPYSFKGGTYPGTGGTCGNTIAASTSCSLIVTYAPTVQGITTATLSLGYNDGVGAQAVALGVRGVASAPALLTVSDGNTFDFGPVATTGSSDKVFTLTNTGGFDASSVTGVVLSTPFTFKGGAFPGTGGTCGSSLSNSGNCTFVVTFAPTANGAASSAISLVYNNGASSQTANRAVQGTGAPPANLILSDGATYNFGTLANGGISEKTFTVSNSGGVDASSLAASSLIAPFSFKGGSYPGTGGTCTGSLGVSLTCTVTAVYSPTAIASDTGQMNLNYFNGLTTATASRPLSGTAVAPGLLLINNGPTYDFGSLAIGASIEATFTVTNSGNYGVSSMTGLALSGTYNFKDGVYPGTSGSCGTALSVGASCTVVLKWTPTATGAQSSNFQIGYNDGSTARISSRPITGTGVAPALITVSDGPGYDFGSRANGSSTDKTIQLTNGGGLTATAMSGGGLVSPFIFKGGSYPGSGGTCSTTLASGATCSVIVSYNPSVTGTSTGSLDFSYSNGVSTQTSGRSVSGTSVTPALLTISDGSTYDFGPVATTGSADKVFTLSNTGNVAATSIVGSGLSAPYAYKGGSFPGSGGTCGSTLATGSSCTFVASFSPTANGSTSSAVSIGYSDGANNVTTTRAIQGAGAPAAALSISDGPTFSFGTVANGGTAQKAFTVTNSGGVIASAISASSLTAPYSFKGGTYPGTGGTCGSSLTVSSSCIIILVYSPTSVGTQVQTVQLNFNNGLSNTNSTRDLTGTAVAPASLSLNNGPTYDFGSLATGSSADATFTLSNGGGFTASNLTGLGLGAPFTYKGGAYPGTGGTCSTSLAVSASCTIVVTWVPTATGSQSSNLLVSFSDGAISQSATRPLTGNGVAPANLTLSAGPSYDFGAVANGSSNDKSLTLTNSGGITALAINGSGLTTPIAFKGGNYPGTGGTCGATLAPSANCTIIVNYSPTSTGSYSSVLSVSYHDGVTIQSTTRSMTGTSSSPASLSISDAATYSFGNRANGSTSDKIFTVTNAGAVSGTSQFAGTLAAPFSYKGGIFPGSGGTCALTLSGGTSCTIVVTFAPTSSGTANATLSLGYNDGVTIQSATRAMTGVSTAPANLTATPSSTYDFGTLATTTSADTTYTLANTGGFDATVLSGSGLVAPYSFKGGSFPGTGGNCPATLAASSSCIVALTYAPTATGTQSAVATFSYFDGANSQTISRNIIGTGAQPATLALSDGPMFDYGAIATGSSSDKSFTLTNSGGFTALSMSGGGLSAPFAFKGGAYPGTGGTCSTTLASNSNCTIVVTYAPSTNGSYTGSIILSYNNGITTTSASRTVTGSAADPAILSISDGATYDFGPVANSGAKDKTFIIANSGGITANSLAGAGLSAPFTFKGGTFPGSGGTCGVTLNGASNCTVVVSFLPISSGTTSATFSVSYNNGVSAQVSSRAIQGTGAPPAAITVSDATTYNFGTFANNSTNLHSFTLTNTGGVQATSLSAAALTAPFSFAGGTFPGTGGTCTGVLANGANCTVVVAYSPTTVATQTDTLYIAYVDGLQSQNSPRPIQGTAVTPAILSLDRGPTYDFGTVAQGAVGEQIFTVTNSGSFTASALSITSLSTPFRFKGSSYPGTGGTCSTSLAVSASCTLVVQFAPSSTGSGSQSIDLNFNDGAQARVTSRAVTGFGAAPAILTLSDGPSFSFGTTANGSVNTKTFTISNSGGVSATSLVGGGLTSPFTFSGGTFPGFGGTCASVLGAASSCTIVIAFSPTSTNSYSSTANISYTDGVTGQVATRALTGASAAAAMLAISDGPTYNYGTVASGAVTTKTLTISNTGGVTATAFSAATFIAPFSYKDGSYPGTGGTCSATLAGSSNCTVVVAFSPVAGGSFSGTVSIGYNDGVSSQTASVNVQGVGAPPANLVISNGATYSYGIVAKGSINEFTFSVTNTGGATATSLSATALLAPYSFKGGSYPGSGGTCGAALTGSAACTIVVAYSPTVTSAADNATITLNFSTGVTTSSATRPVTGVSAAPALITFDTPTTYSYGKLASGASASATLSMTNSGSFTATSLSDGATLMAPFSYTGGVFPGTGGTCSTSLGVGVSCTVVVTFSPSTTGTPTSPVTLAYFDGANTKTVVRSLTGTGATAAILTLSDPNYDYGTVAVGASTAKTFTVTNSGGVPATSIVASTISSDFNYLGGVYPGSGGTCSSTLADTTSNTCTIVVSFAPTSLNAKNGTISLGYLDGLNSQTATRAIAGTGAAPAQLSILPATSPFDYGSVQTGYTLDQTFTIANGGGVTATGVGVTGLAAPFALPGAYPGTGGTCGTSLLASSTCTIVIRFSPLTVGTQSGSAIVGYSTGAGTSSVTKNLAGTGTPPPAPTITRLSPASTPGTSSTVTLTVSGVVATESVKIYRDSACTGTIYATGTVGTSQTSINLTDTISSDGTFNWYATRTNPAGVSSSCSTSTATYARDTTPPILTSAVNQIPGRSPYWSATPTLRISGVFAGDSIKVWSNNACSTLVTTASSVSTSTYYDLLLPTLSTGHYTLYVTAIDSLGNTTSCTSLSPVVYDYDTTYASVTFANYFEQVNEGDAVTIPITLSAAKAYPVTVNYRATGTAITNGSGTLGSSGTVVIPAGSLTANLSFTATANAGNQGNRFVDVALYDSDYEYVMSAGSVFHRVGIFDNSVTVAPPLQLPMGFYAGYYGSCYIDAYKKLWCLGRGTNGTVGDGTTVDKENYVAILATENFAKVVNGQEHACALTAAGGATYPSAGTVLCWGLNGNGQLGDGSTTNKTSPQPVPGLVAIDLSASTNFTCAVKSDNSMWCWGLNNYSQVQLGNTTQQKSPVALDASATAWTNVSIGSAFGCGIRKTTNAINCWGRNYQGATGNGTTTDGGQASLVVVDSGVQYAQVSAGEWFACGLVSAGDTTYPNQIRCWGYNNYGQQGRGNTTSSGAAASVDAANKYSVIAAGKEQLCGVTKSTNSPANAMRCTGRGDLGMLLDRTGTVDNISSFATVQSGIAFKAVTSGYLSSWAVTSTNSVVYGGYENTFANSGDGVTTITKYSNAATYMDQVNTYAKLDSGNGNERATCGLIGSKIRCVGGISDTFGMFGVGSTPDMTGYIWVDPKNDYISVGTGRYHMCAIRVDGKLFCAGQATYNGTTSNSATLTAVDASNTYTAIAVNYYDSCGILTSGVVKCWGPQNGNGQLGDGTTTAHAAPAVADSGFTYSKITVGNNHACGIQAASSASPGRVRCWGLQSNGRLANGLTSAANLLTGVDNSDTSVYTEIAAGSNHTCGISSGTLKCWGYNGFGQIGNGTTTDQGSPVSIDSGNSYLKVGAAIGNTCAVQSSGKMYCWGDWNYGIAGQLGANATTPQAMDPSFTYSDVTMGHIRGCGLTTAGTVRCFGDGRFNAWGDFTRTWVPEALVAPGFIH